MARQVGNDGDINKLNEMTHYTRAADFEALPPTVLASDHTLPPPDAIVPNLVEAGFGDTVPLRDFIFDNSLISALVERWRLETHTWYHTESWALVEQLLGARPPVAAQQEAQRKESFTLKLVWLQDRVRQMPQTDDPETLRQYARCYIMLLIRGYLMTDKSNNLVHLRWLPLLRDFTECRVFSWSSAVLAWTYQSLSLVAQQGITDIADYTPLLMSWIYQRFSQWCPPDRGVYQYPLTARLVGFPQQIRDQHEARVLRWRVSLDRLRFDEFAWRVYDDPALQALCPP
ncbi:serine/threonine-protein phosphatase 7 long form homolog [Arachis hypogaea]|uniref:serine/threonine-protein phosphatase 7 long form homolog n=1 Tax=Arachis hypogaea TaxID=3818 RepID=UPI000DEC22A8|nr:serine/threonine-protein phosphatase 7 long form homolog [Arachis hypogaea]